MKLILEDVSITINGVNLSNHANQVQIGDAADKTDVTSFSAAAHAFTQGFKDATITATFFQDFAATSVHATLLPIYINATPVTITVKPTSGAISSTNPSYEMVGQLFEYDPVSGAAGAAAVLDAKFSNASDIGLVKIISITDGGFLALAGDGSIDGGTFASAGSGSFDGGTL